MPTVDTSSPSNLATKTAMDPFHHLPDALPVLRDFEMRQKLLQWNLHDSLQLQRFRVRRRLPSEADEALLTEFFQDDVVQDVLSLPAQFRSSLTALKEQTSKPEVNGEACSLRFERLRVNVTSMSFFEKLKVANIVARDGSVRGCIDNDFDGCMASDLLTEMLANPTSDNGHVFSDEDREEFIYQLFAALVIGGGALRQAASHVQAYESATRALYRALVSVKKSVANGNGDKKLDVTSRVYRVSGSALFQAPASRFASCFAIVDARKRWVTSWYCPFRSSW